MSDPMKYQMILVEKRESMGLLTLNRPEALNFLDPIMAGDIESALTDFEKDEETRVIVITGAGRAFSAGGDIKFMRDDHSIYEIMMRMEVVTRFIQIMIDLPKPIIASVNGPAIGAGCNMALSADYILCSEKASFAQTFSRIGLIPDFGGLYHLPRRVGITRAKELVFSGRTLDAQEAERIGLVNRVVPDEKLREETLRLGEEMGKGPTLALGIAKRILNQSYESNFETILKAENSNQTLLRKTHDHVEGVRAFFEKRKPQFKGK